MNWLRKIVSGKRRRLKKDNYDLDITYITRRIIAMSFPAVGFEKMYRNAMSDVVTYLDQNHGGHYRVYNMSGRTYDYSKFHGEVESYPWEDHHPPNIDILFKSCHSMYEYLLKNNENVIVVHCNAGKGRTGTSISCFLIYSGLSATAEDAMTYYGRKRFSTGKGVTQPSQKRYIKYFEQIYKAKVKSPEKKLMKSLSFKGVPFLNGDNAKIYFEIVDTKTMDVVYSSKQANMVKYSFFGQHLDMLQCYELLPADDIDLILSGDLIFKIRNGYGFGNSVLCRFSINSSFLGSQIDLTKQELDPNHFKKDTRFPEYFNICLRTEKGCPDCDSSKELNELCQECIKDLEEELSGWSYIQGTLHDLFEDPKKIPSYKKALKIHFLGAKPDYEETLELAAEEISKVKLITGSVRKGTNHQDMNIEMGDKKQISVSKKYFNRYSSDEPSKSQSNESSPHRMKRAGTLFEDLLNENNEYMPDFNQEIHRKHTYFVKPEKLLSENQEAQIEEGKYEFDIPDGESNSNSGNSLDEEDIDHDTPYWKRREIAEGSLYQDILQSNIEKAVVQREPSKQSSKANYGEEDKEESLAAHFAYVDNKDNINNDITHVKRGGTVYKKKVTNPAHLSQKFPQAKPQPDFSSSSDEDDEEEGTSFDIINRSSVYSNKDKKPAKYKDDKDPFAGF
ncbi:unnamed protein product [Moneuplotes crassus]|uniref:Phosphatidylinositol-3,4,5-trisphosphate 3-phosphatase n=2 Tax=Euplotes crassus TaxID=5936 RepID=A0AAD2D6M6_EUPCR|nr:unnamed protein product [Moneuplotes crassus]